MKTPAAHGSLGRYTRLRCRCQPCKDAWNSYQRGRRAESRQRRLTARGTYVVDGIKHGAAGYGYHSCRCDVCVEGKRAIDRRPPRRGVGA
jgi:hypothetical protein